jgi:hypothetical protein
MFFTLPVALTVAVRPISEGIIILASWGDYPRMRASLLYGSSARHGSARQRLKMAFGAADLAEQDGPVRIAHRRLFTEEVAAARPDSGFVWP